ncbi:glycosyltransferase [Pseudomonas sp. OV226]|uniref:glycosyltransferase n=1 Tax=Pseudomonas sp. OV226 TaxID=2135588 RepID=UPI00211503C0|nr:glycosyltransferase [Pseudomonas sp. OV226]
MNFILYSAVNDSLTRQAVGRPQYDYAFILQAYRQVLECFGRVHIVASFAEVDPLARRLSQERQESVFLSFAAPQDTPTDLICPSVCVVAWEFDSIPSRQERGDPQQDWSRILGIHGRVITLSNHAARAIRKALGEDFPVLILPVPLWQNFAISPKSVQPVPINPGSTIDITGCILDTRVLGLCVDDLLPPLPTDEELARIEALKPPPLTPYRRFIIAKHYLHAWVWDIVRGPSLPESGHRIQYLNQWYWEGVQDLLPDFLRSWLARYLPGVAGPLPVPVAPVLELADLSQGAETRVDGVVYVSVLDTQDGRSNWPRLISAFCWAFRDTSDATLVLRITQTDLAAYYVEVLTVLRQLSPFACRVVVLHGELNESQSERLYQAASFYVNASHREGLCLPLMEFMARGTPALAPDHTAMEDYIDETVAFVVNSSAEPAFWPEDIRTLYRTRQYRPDWGSLKNAFQQSYRMSKENPQAYEVMSGAAIARMHVYCSVISWQSRLLAFLGQPVTGELKTASAVNMADNALC